MNSRNREPWPFFINKIFKSSTYSATTTLRICGSICPIIQVMPVNQTQQQLQNTMAIPIINFKFLDFEVSEYCSLIMLAFLYI